MEKIVDIQKVVKELAEVLASNKIPMSSLETVLDSLKSEVYSNTVIQSNN
ncbi:hypothetical protein [Candidatus Clostridium helianthi]|uniref:Uncharacterized protein n=1 Tax=Candidatus Clostridium helianthi TaxID=3381660 RepID=A0ABW8SC60_9CLOT